MARSPVVAPRLYIPEALRHRSCPLKEPVPEVTIEATVTLTHLTAEEGFAGAVQG
jgi:hypothetical protein